jgi:hypothetical protein
MINSDFAINRFTGNGFATRQHFLQHFARAVGRAVVDQNNFLFMGTSPTRFRISRSVAHSL